MPKLIDLTGQKIGRWTVLRRAENKNKEVYWVCQCECGTIKNVKSATLRKGESKSCGCLHKEIAKQTCSQTGKNNKKDLVGQKYGHLTILEDSKKRYSNGCIIWKCQCDCGNITYAPSKFILNNNIFSCGCQQKASQGEYKIMQLLIKDNILFETQKSFENCRFENNYLAKFDFYLPEYNILIEYDGKQHFIEGKGLFDNPISFEKTKQHDEFKNNWCKKNNIKLIRIPYTHFNNLCIEDLLPETSSFIL